MCVQRHRHPFSDFQVVGVMRAAAACLTRADRMIFELFCGSVRRHSKGWFAVCCRSVLRKHRVVAGDLFFFFGGNTRYQQD